ncbi:hypothetical protein BDD12DRAFT_950237 [Trichophaea hybrida]|nr:hypothetical protein BDD12DRAFT_950237 [Trichophaea hybrida]
MDRFNLRGEIGHIGRGQTKRPVERQGECWPVRATYTYGLLVLHLVMVAGLSLGVFFVNGRIVNSTDDRRNVNGTTYLLASDVTTIISGSLVAIRIVTTAWAGIASWKCAFILLEKSTLDLQQFNRIVSAQVPWPLGMGSGRLGFLVTTILLLMLPSALTAPLLSGAVGWRSIQIQVDAGTANTTIPVSEKDQWYWYQMQDKVRAKFTNRAAGLAGLTWANIEHDNPSGCRHVVQTQPVNSTVEDIVLPCIDFHEISWYEHSIPLYIRNVLNGTTNIGLTSVAPFDIYFPGNAVLFDHTAWKNPKASWIDKAELPTPTLFTGEKTVVVIVERAADGSRESIFGEIAQVAHPIFAGAWADAVVGTVNFTAGVITN